MKKPVYISIVAIMALCLIGLTLYIKETASYTNDEVSDFLDRDEKNFKIEENDDKYDFKEVKKIGTNGFFYKKITPIDGIYYYSEAQNPISTSKTDDGKYVIEIGRGIYIFSLNDIFNKYEIKSAGLSIAQLGKGLFMVINQENINRVYSYNSLLKIKMMSGNEEVTSFNLFPALLFQYYPEYNINLKGADILRVATIDNISYLDIKSPTFVEYLLTDKNNSKGKALLKMVDYDFKNKFSKFSKLYTDIISSKDSDISGESFINTYPFMFFNNTKKDIYLKNLLSKNLIHFFANKRNLTNEGSSQQNSIDMQNSIKSIFNDMKLQGDELYNEGIEIFKNYFYVSYYGSLLKSNENILFKDQNNFLKITKNIIPNVSGDEYYSTLSDIYMSYIFSDLKRTNLDTYVDIYLGNLIGNKTLGKDDFLPFSFFLTQYLSANINTSKYSLNILFYLFDITNYYYDSLGNDNFKKFGLVSTEFFNYSRILSRLNDTILETYFSETSKGLILKPKYGGENYANIPKEELDRLSDIYSAGSKELLEKKAFYYKNLGNKTGSSDSYVILRDKFLKLKSILAIINNYSSYIIKINLNAENKNVKGLDFIKDESLSEEKLNAYMSQFNDIDMETLKVSNNFNKDGFYDISVYIQGHNFTFKLNPNGYIVYDLIYIDNEGKKNSQFKGLPISLEEKQKYLKSLFTSEQDPLEKQRYDFRNIFVKTYLEPSQQNDKNENPEDVNTENIDQMPIEIKLFIQNELISKDFKFINNALNIRFQNITAKTQNGEYIIYIKDIKNSFETNKSANNSEISSSYIFKEHMFSDMMIKVRTTDDKSFEFNGDSVSILPEKIYVKDLETKIKDIGYYLDTLKYYYRPGSSNLKIDLNLQKVFIDSEGFNVNIPITGN
ncbi:MAG: hypothetical protein PHS92_04250 [Candidatus Gracilibacteria bacterium]|nr:hypothetical protein [Candidatus Gracilibacteria bacterium]